jgi:hypothetical protein
LAPFVVVGAAVGVVALITEWLLHRDVAEGSR